MKQIRTFFILFLLFFGIMQSQPMMASNEEDWSYPTSDPGFASFDAGDGSAGSPYLISTAQQLANLAYIVTDGNDDVTGKYFKLTKDIYLNDFTVDANGNINKAQAGDLKEWTPIGEYGLFRDDDFQGIFDGNGHTIYGLYMKAQTKRYYVGLFGSTEDAIIKNLTIKNAYINLEKVNCSHHVVGTVVGRSATSTFTNVGVEGCYIYCNFASIGKENFDCGGLLGSGECDMTLNDCSFNGNIKLSVGTQVHTGGLLGRYYMAGSATYQTLRLTRCKSKGSITADYANGQYVYLGGFVGKMSNQIKVYLTECVNMLDLTTTNTTEDSNMTLVYAYNMVPYATEVKRSANLGNISFTSNNTMYSYMYLNGKCTDGYYDCVNYGKYSLPSGHNNKVTIDPGTNQLYHNNKQNLIVWSDAKPQNLESIDSYSSTGKELSWTDLFNQRETIVNKLNEELSENVWGTYDIKGSGISANVTYQLPMPIACGGTTNTLYGNGDGIPYMISSVADLKVFQQMIAKDTEVSAKYRLTCDLDMTNEDVIEPIGDANHPFKGTFDGEGHVISGLSINGRALFGDMSGTVKNLTLLNVKLSGYESGAPLVYRAGNSGSACIESCYVGGSISLEDNNSESAKALAGLCCEVSGNNTVTIKNCYFNGDMNITTTNTDKERAYYGLLYNNNIGSNLELSNCYAAFTLSDSDAKGAGIMANASSMDFDKSNCHYLCSNFTDESGKVDSYAKLAEYYKDVEGWLTGAYRPVLNGARHYELKDYNGNTVYADAIPTDDESGRNDIYVHELTSETANDELVWSLPNVALYNKEEKTNYLLNCQLNADAPFHYSPAEGSVTKGQMHFPLTFSEKDEVKMMCLPATIKTENLPSGARLFVMGKAIGNATTGYSAYTVECDSVPAGVPFLVYVHGYEANKAIDVLLRGKIVSTPQSVVTQGDQEFDSGLIGTFESKNIEKGCATVTADGDVVAKCTENIELKPFSAYLDTDADVNCEGGVVLDETSNDINEFINSYKGKTVSIFFKRKLNTSGWNTLCIPFDLTSDEITKKYGDDTQIEVLSSVSCDDNGTCTLNFSTATSIEAGKCYLVKPTKSDYLWIQLENKKITSDPAGSTDCTATKGSETFTVSFKGSFERTTLTGDDTEKGTYFTQDSKIYKVANGRTIVMNGFRCWIETSKPNALSNGAKMVHSDGTTSIARIVNVGTTADNQQIYDIQGIETASPASNHIYIKNGHKFIKK